MRYEYKVLPAPKAGLKGKGIKSAEDRFANALATTMNILGAEGWEYQRTDTLPASQREGLMGKATVFQNMMVFRRALPEDVELPVAPVMTEETTEEEHVEDAHDEGTENVEADSEPDEVQDEIDENLEELSSGHRLNLNSERM